MYLYMCYIQTLYTCTEYYGPLCKKSQYCGEESGRGRWTVGSVLCFPARHTFNFRARL